MWINLTKVVSQQKNTALQLVLVSFVQEQVDDKNLGFNEP